MKKIIATVFVGLCIYLILGALFLSWVDESKISFIKYFSEKSILYWPIPLFFAAAWMGIGSVVFVFIITVIIPLLCGYLITRIFLKKNNIKTNGKQ